MSITHNPQAIIITGAPGCGKTSIINLLSSMNYPCVPEFAREIIAEQRSIEGSGVYDKDPALFCELMLSRAMIRFQEAANNSVTFFDRGIPDLLAYHACFNLKACSAQHAAERYRYAASVFFLPSWREIYCQDEDRTLTFEQATEFGLRIKRAYERLGYTLIELPRTSVQKRIEFILEKLS